MKTCFFIQLSDGRKGRYRLHKQSVYSSFYSDKDIIDFVLSKGGPEAIAESYYSTMRAQQQIGGQDHDTLTRRANLSWCLPSVKNCEDIIRDGIKTYLEGDDHVKPHRRNTFFSGRAKAYEISKVVDRVNAETGRCPFLV